MNAADRTAYCVIRLNYFSDASWAVICRSSGAIALDADGRLLTRMTEMRANEVAALLSAQPKHDAAVVCELK